MNLSPLTDLILHLGLVDDVQNQVLPRLGFSTVRKSFTKGSLHPFWPSSPWPRTSWSSRGRTCFHTSFYSACLQTTVRTRYRQWLSSTHRKVNPLLGLILSPRIPEPVYNTGELSPSWQSSTSPKKPVWSIHQPNNWLFYAILLASTKGLPIEIRKFKSSVLNWNKSICFLLFKRHKPAPNSIFINCIHDLLAAQLLLQRLSVSLSHHYH